MRDRNFAEAEGRRRVVELEAYHNPVEASKVAAVVVAYRNQGETVLERGYRSCWPAQSGKWLSRVDREVT